MNLQLRRQSNGFLIVEWIVVNDFRQVSVCPSICLFACQSVHLTLHLPVCHIAPIVMFLSTQYQQLGENLTATVMRALEVANHVDMVCEKLDLVPGGQVELASVLHAGHVSLSPWWTGHASLSPACRSR